MKRLARLSIPVIILAVLLCLQSVAVACPTCKDGMANDPQHSSMVQGYFWSILFMMSMPFVILGGLGAYFYYEIARARARQRAAAAELLRPAEPTRGGTVVTQA